MKLTLRPEWRPRPLTSFLGFLDLKTGVTIALLFALLNKVAGVYGLVAVLTGAGGSAAQLSLYIYSVLGLIALVWGLRALSQEDARQTLYFAHIFAADHILSTAWTLFFGVEWWIYTPHDGRRQTNSPAQEEVARQGIIINGGTHNMTDEERAYAAMEIWNEEKGSATIVIVLGWLIKIYFAILLYSYALHLRKGTYRSLPLSRAAYSHHQHKHQHTGSFAGTSALSPVNNDEDEEEIEDFYRLPVRAPPTPLSSTPTALNFPRTPATPFTPSHNPRTPNTASSITSFADFVSAPGRGPGSAGGPRRFESMRKSNLNPASMKGGEEMDEVLFDEDEFGRGFEEGSSGLSTSSSRKGGESTDEDTPTGSSSKRGSRS